jgi:hypothetical protein
MNGSIVGECGVVMQRAPHSVMLARKFPRWLWAHEGCLCTGDQLFWTLQRWEMVGHSFSQTPHSTASLAVIISQILPALVRISAIFVIILYICLWQLNLYVAVPVQMYLCGVRALCSLCFSKLWDVCLCMDMPV